MSEKPINSNDIVNLPPDSELVSDADEEVFILYSELQRSSSPNTGAPATHRGLGHVDSHQDVLRISFELHSNDTSDDAAGAAHEASRCGARSKHRRPPKSGAREKVIDVELAQDKTALRSRKGDTGSVLWRASVDFAQMILQQTYSPSGFSLLNSLKIPSLRVLELGSGIGLLSVVLSPLFQQYIATDIGALMPLIKKNLSLNSSIASPSATAEELDWLALHSTPPSRRSLLFPSPSAIDLVLVVDCIYHPSLLPALVETLEYLSAPVLVVVELRSHEVIQSFLELWLAKPGWKIWRVGRDNALPRPYAIWFGHRP